MKPTVIGGGQPAQPTVIEPTKVGPTTIGPTQVKPTSIANEPAKIEPTRIADLADQYEMEIKPLSKEEFRQQFDVLKKDHSAKTLPTTPNFTEVKAKPVVAKVTTLPGTQVKCLEVDVLELQTRFPSESPTVLDETRKVLSTVSPEILSTAEVIMFGLDVQGKQTELTDKWLKILQDDLLRKNSRHIERLRDVLNDVIDEIGKKSWFRKQTIREKFEDDKVEIEQLKKLLADGMYHLNMTHLSLSELSKEAHWLTRMFQAYVLACEYLAGILDQEKSRLITDRGISFTKSLSLIHTTVVKLDQNLQSITGLIAQVQDGVMVGIPSIMQAVAITTEETDTEKYLLKEQILDVIRKLS